MHSYCLRFLIIAAVFGAHAALAVANFRKRLNVFECMCVLFWRSGPYYGCGRTPAWLPSSKPLSRPPVVDLICDLEVLAAAGYSTDVSQHITWLTVTNGALTRPNQLNEVPTKDYRDHLAPMVGLAAPVRTYLVALRRFLRYLEDE